MNLRLLLVSLVATFAGCGGELATVPVTGKITKGGAPVEGMGVTLVGVEGTKAIGLRGVTLADGTFKISAVGGIEGAPVGDYKVVLIPPMTAPDYSKMDKNGPKPGMKIPETYTNVDKATEKIKVGSGPNEIKIDIPD